MPPPIPGAMQPQGKKLNKIIEQDVNLKLLLYSFAPPISGIEETSRTSPNRLSILQATTGDDFRLSTITNFMFGFKFQLSLGNYSLIHRVKE